MPYFLAVYDWSQFTLPSAIPMSDIEGDSHANDPAHPDYEPAMPTWVGETFTFNGGAPSQLQITDDDDQFEDGYVETGGAQTLTQDVTINGTTYLAGSVIENEFSMVDSLGNEVFVIRIDGVNVGFGYPEGQEPTNGSDFTAANGRDGDPLDSGDGTSSSSESYSTMVCYAEGTMIMTPDGERAIESLRPGDHVMTFDRGAPRQIRWTRRDTHALDGSGPEDKPVLIKAGSLGSGLPACNLIVSPQHRIMVGHGGQLQGPFKTGAFAPAKSLTTLPGIRYMKGKTQITWVHFACDRHEIVIANGCLSESLLLGPMVVNGLTTKERRALTAIYGPAPSPGTALNGAPALPCLRVGEVRRRLAEHARQNGDRTECEIQKWDRDLAMERYEAERLRDAPSPEQHRGTASRVA